MSKILINDYFVSSGKSVISPDNSGYYLSSNGLYTVALTPTNLGDSYYSLDAMIPFVDNNPGGYIGLLSGKVPNKNDYAGVIITSIVSPEIYGLGVYKTDTGGIIALERVDPTPARLFSTDIGLLSDGYFELIYSLYVPNPSNPHAIDVFYTLSNNVNLYGAYAIGFVNQTTVPGIVNEKIGVRGGPGYTGSVLSHVLINPESNTYDPNYYQFRYNKQTNINTLPVKEWVTNRQIRNQRYSIPFSISDGWYYDIPQDAPSPNTFKPSSVLINNTYGISTVTFSVDGGFTTDISPGGVFQYTAFKYDQRLMFTSNMVGQIELILSEQLPSFFYQPKSGGI